ncbi:MAG: HNH endonuclease, partial [Rikenellaceae bacterium]|nr:HNH endonuclease [Rikenellaceae bacterium]
MRDLAYYIKCFKKLHRATVFGGAPHKPILLLSVLEAFERGFITSRYIYITPELIAFFRGYWKHLVTTEHKCNFALPYFHMRSEPFWRLIEKPGNIIPSTKSKSIKSFKSLLSTCECAVIDPELFLLLSGPKTREILRQTLLRCYFTVSIKSVKYGYEYLNYIVTSILSSPSAEYRIDYEKATDNDSEGREEEEFIRGTYFKKEVKRIYSNTCCITGLGINTDHHFSLIDACHIYQVSISHDDTVTNGIALCPTMHRAFDRGLVTITPDYRVEVSSCFEEVSSCGHSIKIFHGKKILLPFDKTLYPSAPNLEWHHHTRFRG